MSLVRGSKVLGDAVIFVDITREFFLILDKEVLEEAGCDSQGLRSKLDKC